MHQAVQAGRGTYQHSVHYQFYGFPWPVVSPKVALGAA